MFCFRIQELNQQGGNGVQLIWELKFIKIQIKWQSGLLLILTFLYLRKSCDNVKNGQLGVGALSSHYRRDSWKSQATLDLIYVALLYKLFLRFELIISRSNVINFYRAPILEKYFFFSLFLVQIWENPMWSEERPQVFPKGCIFSFCFFCFPNCVLEIEKWKEASHWFSFLEICYLNFWYEQF